MFLSTYFRIRSMHICIKVAKNVELHGKFWSETFYALKFQMEKNETFIRPNTCDKQLATFTKHNQIYFWNFTICTYFTSFSIACDFTWIVCHVKCISYHFFVSYSVFLQNLFHKFRKSCPPCHGDFKKENQNAGNPCRRCSVVLSTTHRRQLNWKREKNNFARCFQIIGLLNWFYLI